MTDTKDIMPHSFVLDQTLNLTDFMALDLPDDRASELESGHLLLMPPESELNRRIAMRLLVFLVQRGFTPEQLTMKTEIVTSGSRATVRLPDLMVLSEELVLALSGATRSTISVDLPPPLLVVEVVSPGVENENRDYRYKRSEYGARGIGEYWIVDPQRQTVTVLVLVDGFYEEQVFTREERVVSRLLGELNLKIDELWE